MNLTKVKSTKIKDSIRYIKTIFSITKLNIQAGPYGVDAVPHEGVNAITIKVGKYSFVIGYAQKAFLGLDKGESVIYSKDADGYIASYIINRNDGTIEMNGADDNLVRFSDLKSEFNELQSKYNDLIDRLKIWTPAPGDGGTALKTLLTTPTPISRSDADIETAKHDRIKTDKKPLI